jgi:phospholipase C
MRVFRIVAAVAIVIGTVVARPLPAPAATGEAHAPRTPVQHLLFLLQDHHTFDNYFGTRPRVDGLPADVCMPVDLQRGKGGRCVRPGPAGGSASGTGLSSSVAVATDQIHGGRMDGFVSAYTARGRDGARAMEHYGRSDLPVYNALADNYVLFDHWFSSAVGGSVRNRLYSLAAARGSAISHVVVPARGWGDVVRVILDGLLAGGVWW